MPLTSSNHFFTAHPSNCTKENVFPEGFKKVNYIRIYMSKWDAPPGAAWRFLFSALDTRFRCGATESTLPKKSIAKCFYWPNFRSMVLPS